MNIVKYISSFTLISGLMLFNTGYAIDYPFSEKKSMKNRAKIQKDIPINMQVGLFAELSSCDSMNLIHDSTNGIADGDAKAEYKDTCNFNVTSNGQVYVDLEGDDKLKNGTYEINAAYSIDNKDGLEWYTTSAKPSNNNHVLTAKATLGEKIDDQLAGNYSGEVKITVSAVPEVDD